MIPQTDAYDFFHRGTIALSEIECTGMRIDVDYLDRKIKQTENEIQDITERLQDSKEYVIQQRLYGKDTNITSRDQLAKVLFNELGHKCHTRTKTGKPQLNETALEKINSPYCRDFVKLEKLNKASGTYLKGLRREVSGDLIHGFFGLSFARTFRGNADSPNLQNIPIRDKVQQKLVRKAFIPRDGNVLIEVDYKSLEVMVACAVSGDPKLTHDAIKGDMHRDMAAELFMVSKKNVSKNMRQAAKNGFVFAEFYGDWYKACAKNLFEWVERADIHTEEGEHVFDHLSDQGIDDLSEFEYHVEAVEKRFWEKRFKVYHKKRAQWVKEYNQCGYLDMVTGFRCHGPMRKNQVLNSHIQGPAFHCLLWCLIQLVRDLRRLEFGARVVCTIHDSIIADVPRNEVDAYLRLVNEICTERLLDAWEWITVPLEIEAEIAENNWFEKKPVAIPK